jgi:hypothetical protein
MYEDMPLIKEKVLSYKSPIRELRYSIEPISTNILLNNKSTLELSTLN